MKTKIMHKLSKIFQPVSTSPKGALLKKQDVTSKSQKLLLELGVIKQANPGSYHFLPLGLRALEKLTKLVDKEMQLIGGQKVHFPSLINRKLWEKTGRITEIGPELFHVKDRHEHGYILSPTHEEAASEIFGSSAPSSYKNFPLKLYQTTEKFRDEMKPRFGLLRSRQFFMKDLYSFDTSIENAKKTYEEICNSYDSIFNQIGVDFVKVEGSVGSMGGKISHEYHYRAEIGEDKIVTCQSCHYSANLELLDDPNKCVKCSGNTNISLGIEVGHTFLLGDRYSKPLGAFYLNKMGKPEVLQMGSYGLGLSRIIGASLQVLSLEHEMRWPDCIAPYNVVIIPPKSGSKEQENTLNYAEDLYWKLEEVPDLQENILLDDRTSLTIGKRFLDAKRMGYRFIIAIGQKATQEVPLFELNDLKTNEQFYLTIDELCNYVKEKLKTADSVFSYYNKRATV